jgi:hypothetical protein
MSNRPITVAELQDKWDDALAIAKDDSDYEAINLIEEFREDLRDLGHIYV